VVRFLSHTTRSLGLARSFAVLFLDFANLSRSLPGLPLRARLAFRAFFRTLAFIRAFHAPLVPLPLTLRLVTPGSRLGYAFTV